MNQQQTNQEPVTVELVCYQCHSIFTTVAANATVAEIITYFAEHGQYIAPFCPLCRDSAWRNAIEAHAPQHRPSEFPHTLLYRQHHDGFAVVAWDEMFTREIFTSPCGECRGVLLTYPKIASFFEDPCPRCSEFPVPF